MATPPPGSSDPRARRPKLSKTAKIGLGLLLTFLGLALASLLLPTEPGQLGRLLPVAAAGLLLLWLGGILMGIGSRS
jgi:hypothetical protein